MNATELKFPATINRQAAGYFAGPVNIDEVMKVEEKLLQIQRMRKSSAFDNYRATVASLIQLLHMPRLVTKISVPGTDGRNFLKVQDILYMQGDNNYTAIYLTNQKKVVVARTLKDYEEMLCDSGFVRIHKSSMINLQHLKKISRKDGLEAIMTDGQVLLVSRRKSAELLSKAKMHIGNL